MRSLLALTALALLSTGCATIISGRTQDVAFHSIPSGADVTLDNGAKTVTPGTLTLKRRTDWNKSVQYLATFTKEPFAERQAEIRQAGNWWMLGNVLLGGYIGLIVDLVTGASSRLVPGDVIVDMATGTIIPVKDFKKAESRDP